MQTPQDTLTLVKKYQAEAGKAIIVQDYENAIVKLRKANRLSAKLDNESLKADLLLTSTRLHYYLQNYNKAASDNLDAIELLEK